MTTEKVSKSTELLNVLAANPGGMTIGDVVDRSGVNKALCSYHLNQLKRKKLVKLDKRTHLWSTTDKAQPPGTLPTAPQLFAPDEMPAPPPRNNKPRGKKTRHKGEAAAQILEYMRAATGPVTNLELANALKMNHSNVRNYMGRMAKDGKIAHSDPKDRYSGWVIGTGDAQPAKRKNARRDIGEHLPAPLVPVRGVSRNAMISVGPNGFNARQVQAIILRMQNANDYAEFFTGLDFATLEKLLEAVR